MNAEYGDLKIQYEPRGGAHRDRCLQEAQGIAWKYGVRVEVTHNATKYTLDPYAPVNTEGVSE